MFRIGGSNPLTELAITELTPAIEQEGEKSPQTQRLMTHTGVGASTALAFVLIIGDADRFRSASRLPAT